MKPIIFSTPMVKAILDGRKTMTRRVIKAPVLRNVREPDEVLFDGKICKFNWHGDDVIGGFEIKPPYQSGDILWVRETWFENEECLLYKASKYENTKEYHGRNGWVQIKWRPSIFMPREAARIFLKVKNIRVEKVQDITEADAKAEGARDDTIRHLSVDTRDYQKHLKDEINIPLVIADFIGIWNSINGKRGYGWNKNPWVWVYEFEKISRTGGE